MELLIKVDALDTGMYYHRLFTPFERFREQYPEVRMEATPVQKNEKGQNVVIKTRSLPPEYISTFSAVVFSREIEGDGTTEETINFLHENGCKIVLEIDDYWELDKSHPIYKRANGKLNKETIKALKGADLVITPTPYLTEACKQYNDNSYTVKTCINPAHPQWSSPSISSSIMRFGWIGGIYHLQDVQILTNSINTLLDDETLSGKYQICLGGFSSQKITSRVGNQIRTIITNSYYWTIEKIFTNNYKYLTNDYKKFLDEFNPSLPDHISYYQPYRRLWTKPIDEYGNLYNEIDVCLVPLSSLGHFNQYKSELKLIEAGMKGKMAIVSRVKPYTLVPEDCVHFVDKGDIYGWYKAMKYCIENPEYVKEKAKKLQEYIQSNYVLDEQNEIRYNLISEVCNK